MDIFKSAHAGAETWEQTAIKCLAQLGSIPESANLGFLYVTDVLASSLPETLKFIKEETGIDNWVGSVGMGICAAGREYYDRAAIAMMVAEFPENSFRIFPTIKTDLQQFMRANKDWYESAHPCFGILHADPRNPHVPEFIEELSEEIADSYFVGGLTSSRTASLQIAKEITEGGISGVLFSKDNVVTTALTQGCSPIGEKHVITECERNIAVRLDDQPALDVFKKEVGEIIARNPDKATGHIFVGMPIHGSDTGDYLVRNLVGFDPENKLLAVADMLECGEQIQFCRRDAGSAHADLLRMLHDIRNRSGRAPKGGVYYTCLGRGQNLFGDDSEELKTIIRELGDFPLVGFFANGEISNNRLYGYTGVLTLFF